jgi:hypothetical protein
VQRLVKLKSGLATLEDLGCSALEPAGEADEEGELNSEEERWLLGDPNRLGADSDGDSESLGSLESDELDGLLADEKENVAIAPRQPKNSKASSATAAPKQGKEKKAKKQPKAPKPVAPLASLASIGDDDAMGSLSASSSKRAKRSNGKAQYSDELAESFGEPTALATSDAADKAARRKSLQFYTGQISAKEARRGDAARKSLGGDSDIPYRDRERSRMVVAQTAANRAAKASSREAADMELDGEAFGEEDLRDWRDVMGQDVAKGASAGDGGAGQDEDEDYYDLVASRQRQAKKAKKDEYEAARDEERSVRELVAPPPLCSHRLPGSSPTRRSTPARTAASTGRSRRIAASRRGGPRACATRESRSGRSSTRRRRSSAARARCTRAAPRPSRAAMAARRAASPTSSRAAASARRCAGSRRGVSMCMLMLRYYTRAGTRSVAPRLSSSGSLAHPHPLR